jgi:hypothetical protein
VFLNRLGVDKEVVHVDEKAEIDHVAEDMVHHNLEGCWYVSQSEEHDHELVKAVSCAEGGFPFVSFSDTDQMEAILQVHFCEPLGSLGPIL